MSETLTKAKLVEHLHERVGVSKKEASELVEEVFSIMRNSLSSGEKVKISGFGNFLIRDKSARRGRNPQTNEEIIIARRRVLTFKPSQVLRTVLNKVS
jgi:integration host factor subunit alpha